MKLAEKTKIGIKYGERDYLTSIVYYIYHFLKKHEINWKPIRKIYYVASFLNFNSKWLEKQNGEKYYNLNGAKLPYHRKHPIYIVFQDTFFIHCLCQGNYDGKLVRYLDKYLPEGAYCITEGDLDVTIKPDDIVFDVGSWIGDFAALATTQGATTYAFEPSTEIFNYLVKTANLNTKGKIIPIKMGLGADQYNGKLINNKSGSIGNYIASEKEQKDGDEIIITTIDAFVENNQLQRVDFIKADIEGHERYMLEGAKETLKKFAPKLAICTYHLPDDPETLKKIILDANPNYKIIQLQHKLFAQVVK